MADKRMLSKTISTSIRVGHLKTSDAMLLFTWIIPHCDDDGRLQGDPLYIKSVVFPMIECTIDNIQEWLSDMVRTKLIEWYEVNAEKYIQVNKWLDFQRLRSDRYKPSKYPAPENSQPSDNHKATNRQPSVGKCPRKLVKIRLDKYSILSQLLFDEIKKRRANFKKPNMETWDKHIDSMIRVDKRDSKEIERVIKWCQADEFWQNNILSTFKLRKQFDQLALKAGKAQGQDGGSVKCKQCGDSGRYAGIDENGVCTKCRIDHRLNDK